MNLILGRVARVLIVVVLASLLACTNYSAAPPAGDADLRDTLSAVEGEFTWNDEVRQYVFSDKLRLDEIISSGNPELVLAALVDCLDDLSPSASRLDGKKVAVGIICYEALTLLTYYEATAPGGDIARDWPGHISPTATGGELRAAKEAWSQVLKEDRYVFL